MNVKYFIHCFWHTSMMHPASKYCKIFTSPPSVPCHTSKHVLFCGTDTWGNWGRRGGEERGEDISSDPYTKVLWRSAFFSTSLVQAVVTSSPPSVMGMAEISWVSVSSLRTSRTSLKLGLCWGNSLQHQHISSSIQREEGWC